MAKVMNGYIGTTRSEYYITVELMMRRLMKEKWYEQD